MEAVLDPTDVGPVLDAEPPRVDPSFAMPVESWRRLFAQVAEGRLSALGELYEAAAERLHGLALWRTGSADDAAEVVQEVFVRLAERRQQLPGVRDPRAWLLSVTHRAAVDRCRRNRRRQASGLEDCRYLEGRSRDSDRHIDAERASRLLGQLPEKQRDVIYLKHFADCSFAEIGRVTGVPTFTAASRYRLGMKRLRSLLEGGAR